MKIDGNEKAMEGMKRFYEGNRKEAARLDAEFRAEVLASGEDHCSCKIPCETHGNCKECVISHRGARNHLPCCLWNMVNEIADNPNGLCAHIKPSMRKNKKTV
ncbi:MAG TPA: LPS biosynthesis protein [Clostridia bacterium]|nr:LPS biosynthesis protein [Clostridia bacterium]